MKFLKYAVMSLSLLIIAATSLHAAELTMESLEGEWLYTHIIMDDGKNMPVNFTTKFQPDGSVIWVLPTGAEYGRGEYEITGDTITYKDDKGPQEWKVVTFEQDSLHVDHRGAEMFFERR